MERVIIYMADAYIADALFYDALSTMAGLKRFRPDVPKPSLLSA